MKTEISSLREWSPTFSSQGKKERNCGLHCVAMITGLPIQLVAEQIGRNGPTNEIQLQEALRWFGWDSGLFLNKCRHFELLPKLCILDLHRPRKWNGHWSVWYDGVIWDSCVGVYDNPKLYLENTGLRLKGFIEVKLVN